MSPLYEPCAGCGGSRLAPPDARIHETLPEHSAGVRRPHRAGRAPCPDCQGVGYTRTPISLEGIGELASEHKAALKALQDLVDRFAVSELDGDISYLSDPMLREWNMLAEAVLDRARKAGRGEPERHGLRR